MAPEEMFLRLLMAAFCSGLIGFERASALRAAGMRTHTLVGVGAAVFSILSIAGFEAADESRIAAQIVTGVGFLGAGAIFKEGGSVSGLTTAAGLWITASLGMAAGSGSYSLAALGTVVTLSMLIGLRAVDAAVRRRRVKVQRRLEVHVGDVSKLEKLLAFIQRVDPGAEQIDFTRTGGSEGVLVVTCNEDEVAKVADMVASHKSVTKVEELSPLHWRQKPRKYQAT
ncbi:MAG TPA: MgtC/SapB family protein [Euzebyales bacterium]|nr:MgtC/SapB family protein [Euzebyales bacterium]